MSGIIRPQMEMRRSAPSGVRMDGIATVKEAPVKRISKRKLLAGFLGFFLLAMLSFGGYYYLQYKKTLSVGAASVEESAYLEKIGKFLTLPVDEMPTMATVSDKNKLSSQSFFSKAENGDKVFFYAKVQKAILYRPSSNMVIEMTSAEQAPSDDKK